MTDHDYDKDDFFSNPFYRYRNENAVYRGVEIGFPESQILPYVGEDVELCGELSACFHLGKPFLQTLNPRLNSMLDVLTQHESYGAFSDSLNDEDSSSPTVQYPIVKAIAPHVLHVLSSHRKDAFDCSQSYQPFDMSKATVRLLNRRSMGNGNNVSTPSIQ